MADNRRVDFDALKAQADFRTVLAHYGITAQGAGDQLKALCPLHDDRRASLSLNMRERVFHCFAPDCPAHEGGDIIAFVHLIETHRGSSGSLRQAAIRLADICGIDLESGDAPPRRQGGPRSARRRERVRTAPGKPARAPEGGNGPEEASPGSSGPENRPFNRTLTLDPAHPYLA